MDRQRPLPDDALDAAADAFERLRAPRPAAEQPDSIAGAGR
jgi:hypothetical protein